MKSFLPWRGLPRPRVAAAAALSTSLAKALGAGLRLANLSARPDAAPHRPGPATPDPRNGSAAADSGFTAGTFSNTQGTRAYRLFVPPGHGAASAPTPLLVMLHGCTQTPEDFALGTRMNALAQAHGLLVLYPAQAAAENGSKCWNWFRPQDQERERGEPAILAGMTRQIARQWNIDTRRIWVAGLSAGAAMAVILGRTYPELFAAVGAHSGLPYKAAADVPTAFRAMRAGPAAARQGGESPHARQPPTIVFHGDHDTTVSESNGAAIIADLLDGTGATTLPAAIERSGSIGGRVFRQTCYSDKRGRSLAERWSVEGMAHAWSGGDAAGSYTDAKGPDASAEMLRFFSAVGIP